MKVSRKGKKFIRKHEGMIGKVYADRDTESNKQAGLARWEDAKPYTDRGWPTIGIGHLIYFEGSWNKDERARFARYLRDGDRMTEQQMWDLLDEDLVYFETQMTKKLDEDIPQESFDALVAMAFNTGMGNANLKEAIRLTNEKQYQKAAEAIMGGPITGSGSTGTLGGLVKRRKEEAEKYLDGFMGGNALTAGFNLGPLRVTPLSATIAILLGLGAWTALNWEYVKQKLEI